jgi:hypothetical protein
MTGGALQAGDINYDSFAKAGFDAYANRQPSPLVDDLYQSKLDKTFMGFPSYQQQQLTGPDMGEYIASGTDVPLELTTAGRLQSGLSSIGKGITGLADKMKGGPLTSVISMLLGGDKFDTLSELDQQFIKENMGYRGPTVFGENTSGLYKDPFGVNTRSLRGNYAEKVRDEFGSLGDSLTGRLSDKYGASFNPETGMFESEDEEAAARANKMTKMMRAKYNFRQKQIEQQKFNEKIAAQQKAAEERAFQERVAREADTASRARSQNQAVYESADRQGFTNRDGGFSTSRADRAGTSEGSGQFSSRSGRGRTGYLSGGLADMLEIYD